MKNNRSVEAKVSDIFPDRWSPRSFQPDFKIGAEDLASIMEAARWAPSSFNEQPWTIHVAQKDSSAFDQFARILVESNSVWAKNASVLGFIVGKKTFSRNDKENSTFEFDCGSAWMSLTLQARMLGLHTHGMVGFDRDLASQALKTDPEKEKVIAAFAIGKRDEPDKLPEPLREREIMSPRKSLDSVYILHKDLKE